MILINDYELMLIMLMMIIIMMMLMMMMMSQYHKLNLAMKLFLAEN